MTLMPDGSYRPTVPISGKPPKGHNPPASTDQRDARIAALEAELAEARATYRQHYVDWETAAVKSEALLVSQMEANFAALEAEVERLKSFEIYEVFTAADGEPATRPVNWPEKVAELEAFKRDVCRRASQDQHGWSAWVAGWQRREDS